MKLLRPLIASSLLHAATAQTAEATDAEPQLYAPYSYGGDGDDDYYPPGDAFFHDDDDDYPPGDAFVLPRTPVDRNEPSFFDDDFFYDEEEDYDPVEWWYEDEDVELWTWSKYREEEEVARGDAYFLRLAQGMTATWRESRDAPEPQTERETYVVEERDDVLPCLLAGAAVVMAGGIGIGFVLGLLYASQRQRALPAIMYRIASKEVDAVGLADLALAEVEIV